MKKKLKKISKKLSGKLSMKSGLFFLLIGLFMAILASLLVIPELFFIKNFEDFLPEKDLIGFIKVENFQAPEQLSEKYPQVKTDFNKYFSTILGIDLEKTNIWRGKRAGIALYEDNFNVESPYSWVVLFEITNKKEAEIFLNKLAGNEENLVYDNRNKIKVSILKNRNFKCALFESYLVCSDKGSNIFDKLLAEERAIVASADYQRWQAQMPKKAYLKAYFRTEKINKIIPNFASLINGNIETGGLVLEEKENQLAISMFFVKKQKNAEIFSQEEQEDLLTILPKETIFFLNGKNTKNTIDTALNEMSHNDPELKTYFLARTRAIIQNNYFSETVSLENDIFPLFSKNFVFAFVKTEIISKTEDQEEIEEKLVPLLIINTDDEIFAEEKRKKLAKGFEEILIKESGEIIEETLENEETIKEIFPLGSEAIKIEKDFNDAKTVYLKGKDKEMAIARKNNLLIISTDTEILKEVITKIDQTKFKRETSKIVENFNIKTFSSADETFAFDKSFVSSLPIGDYVNKLYFIDTVSGKIVRIPDAFRVDIQIAF